MVLLSVNQPYLKSVLLERLDILNMTLQSINQPYLKSVLLEAGHTEYDLTINQSAIPEVSPAEEAGHTEYDLTINQSAIPEVSPAGGWTF
jgi:hypothetical protein